MTATPSRIIHGPLPRAAETARGMALTVIRYGLDGPPTVMASNDVAHLPAELRWTGYPEHLRW